MHAKIAQNRTDLTCAFKICRGRTPDPILLTRSLTVRNFKEFQATQLNPRNIPVVSLDLSYTFPDATKIYGVLSVSRKAYIWPLNDQIYVIIFLKCYSKGQKIPLTFLKTRRSVSEDFISEIEDCHDFVHHFGFLTMPILINDLSWFKDKFLFKSLSGRACTIQSISVHYWYRNRPKRIDTVIMLYRYIWKYNFTLDFHTIKQKT